MLTNTAAPRSAASERTTPVPGGDPRFDLSGAGAPPPRRDCQSCNVRLSDRYWRLDGAVCCAKCLGEVRRSEAMARRWSSLAHAARRAAPIAVLGGVGYALLVWATDAWFAFVTIGIGYLVGGAVRSAAGRFATRRHQVLAVALTYAAVCLGNVAPVARALRAETTQVATAAGAWTNTSASSANDGAEATNTPTLAEGGASATTARPGRLVRFAASALALLVVCMLMPLLSVTSGLSGALSLFIVGVGLWKAWQRSAGEPFAITGPHLLAGAAPTSHDLG